MQFLRFGSMWLAAALGVVALAAPPSANADPNKLWQIVHDRCVPHERAGRGPSPCLAVRLKSGYVVLKDNAGANQVLVIPTARVTGIEDPKVLAAGAPNYFAYAWTARSYVDGFAKQTLPRDELALVVNSVDGRTQNQLHIHVDCIRAAVRTVLAADLANIGPSWAPIDLGIQHRHYEAMSLTGDDLGAHNPFKLLADGDPAAKADMSLETLVAAPVTLPDGKPGFILLADRADPSNGDDGSGEELQDHGCAILQPPPG